MKKSLLFLVLVALATAAVRFDNFVSAQHTSAQLASTKSTPLEERIKHVESGLLPAVLIKGAALPPGTTLTERLAHYQIPGVSIAVVNDGRVEWARAYGLKDATTKKPVTTETLFQPGSISNPGAALAALKLVDPA